jgi:hypothetical protein
VKGMMAARNGYNTPASRMPDRPMLVINDPADFVPDIIQPKPQKVVISSSSNTVIQYVNV